MANSPSHRWENGVLVERAIETNRWKVDRYGNPIIEADEPEVEEKRVASAENKAVTTSKTKRS